MSLKDTITEAVKTAMKAKDLEQVKVLRNIQAAIKQVEIDSQKELGDTEILTILQKQLKQRQESQGIFSANGRDDLAQKEQFEIEIITQFFPKPLTEEALTKIVAKAIETLGASDIKDMGRVMSAIKEETVGRADQATVSALVKNALKA